MEKKIHLKKEEFDLLVKKMEKIKENYFDPSITNNRALFVSAGDYLPSIEELLEYEEILPSADYVNLLLYYATPGIYDRKNPDSEEAELLHKFARESISELVEIDEGTTEPEKSRRTKTERQRKSPMESKPKEHRLRERKVKLTFDEYDHYYEQAEKIANGTTRPKGIFSEYVKKGSFPTVEEIEGFEVERYFKRYLTYLIYFREPALYAGDDSEECKKMRKYLTHLFDRVLTFKD
ncbi:MAG: hypothetical protein Q4B26_02235 [Eubacteriales bacterium]|nr:hypothetical protein [Eubacteriales bacterium]